MGLLHTNFEGEREDLVYWISRFISIIHEYNIEQQSHTDNVQNKLPTEEVCSKSSAGSQHSQTDIEENYELPSEELCSKFSAGFQQSQTDTEENKLPSEEVYSKFSASSQHSQTDVEENKLPSEEVCSKSSADFQQSQTDIAENKLSSEKVCSKFSASSQHSQTDIAENKLPSEELCSKSSAGSQQSQPNIAENKLPSEEVCAKSSVASQTNIKTSDIRSLESLHHLWKQGFFSKMDCEKVDAASNTDKPSRSQQKPQAIVKPLLQQFKIPTQVTGSDEENLVASGDTSLPPESVHSEQREFTNARAGSTHEENPQPQSSPVEQEDTPNNIPSIHMDTAVSLRSPHLIEEHFQVRSADVFQPSPHLMVTGKEAPLQGATCGEDPNFTSSLTLEIEGQLQTNHQVKDATHIAAMPMMSKTTPIPTEDASTLEPCATSDETTIDNPSDATVSPLLKMSQVPIQQGNGASPLQKAPSKIYEQTAEVAEELKVSPVTLKKYDIKRSLLQTITASYVKNIADQLLASALEVTPKDKLAQLTKGTPKSIPVSNGLTAKLQQGKISSNISGETSGPLLRNLKVEIVESTGVDIPQHSPSSIKVSQQPCTAEIAQEPTTISTKGNIICPAGHQEVPISKTSSEHPEQESIQSSKEREQAEHTTLIEETLHEMHIQDINSDGKMNVAFDTTQPQQASTISEKDKKTSAENMDVKFGALQETTSLDDDEGIHEISKIEQLNTISTSTPIKKVSPAFKNGQEDNDCKKMAGNLNTPREIPSSVADGIKHTTKMQKPTLIDPPPNTWPANKNEQKSTADEKKITDNHHKGALPTLKESDKRIMSQEKPTTKPTCKEASPTLKESDKHIMSQEKPTTKPTCKEASPTLKESDKHIMSQEKPTTKPTCKEASPTLKESDKHIMSQEKPTTTPLCKEASPTLKESDKHIMSQEKPTTKPTCKEASPTLKESDKHIMSQEKPTTKPTCKEASPTLKESDKHIMSQEKPTTKPTCKEASPTLKESDKHIMSQEKPTTKPTCKEASPTLKESDKHIVSQEKPTTTTPLKKRNKHIMSQQKPTTKPSSKEASPTLKETNKRIMSQEKATTTPPSKEASPTLKESDKHIVSQEKPTTTPLCKEASPTLKESDKHIMSQERPTTTPPSKEASPSLKESNKNIMSQEKPTTTPPSKEASPTLKETDKHIVSQEKPTTMPPPKETSPILQESDKQIMFQENPTTTPPCKESTSSPFLANDEKCAAPNGKTEIAIVNTDITPKLLNELLSEVLTELKCIINGKRAMSVSLPQGTVNGRMSAEVYQPMKTTLPLQDEEKHAQKKTATTPPLRTQVSLGRQHTLPAQKPKRAGANKDGRKQNAIVKSSGSISLTSPRSKSKADASKAATGGQNKEILPYLKVSNGSATTEKNPTTTSHSKEVHVPISRNTLATASPIMGKTVSKQKSKLISKDIVKKKKEVHFDEDPQQEQQIPTVTDEAFLQATLHNSQSKKSVFLEGTQPNQSLKMTPHMAKHNKADEDPKWSCRHHGHTKLKHLEASDALSDNKDASTPDEYGDGDKDSRTDSNYTREQSNIQETPQSAPGCTLQENNEAQADDCRQIPSRNFAHEGARPKVVQAARGSGADSLKERNQAVYSVGALDESTLQDRESHGNHLRNTAFQDFYEDFTGIYTTAPPLAVDVSPTTGSQPVSPVSPTCIPLPPLPSPPRIPASQPQTAYPPRLSWRPPIPGLLPTAGPQPEDDDQDMVIPFARGAGGARMPPLLPYMPLVDPFVALDEIEDDYLDNQSTTTQSSRDWSRRYGHSSGNGSFSARQN